MNSVPQLTAVTRQPIFHKHGLTVSVHSSELDLTELRPTWERLATHPKVDPDIFFSRFGRDTSGAVEPLVLAARQNGKVVGLLVARRESRELEHHIGPLTLLRSHARVIIVSDRGVMMSDPSTEAQVFVLSLLRLLQRGVAHFVHFASLDIDSPIRQVVSQVVPRICRSVFEDLEPRWWLEVPLTYEQFLADRSKKTRSHLRQNERAILHHYPDCRVKVFRRNDPKIGSLFPSVMEVCQRTYQYKLGYTPLCSPSAGETWRELSRLGRLIVALVYIGNLPVAFAHAQIYRTTAALITPGYNPVYAHVNVGQYCLLQLIRALIQEDDIISLDYGLGYAQYKESLGTRCTWEGHVRVFARTARGLYINAVRTVAAGANRELKKIAGWMGIGLRLKRLIRSMAKRS